jgi:NAD(P)-dependent dehydrogenase (short-subunit alcohol dehydrogenase family)
LSPADSHDRGIGLAVAQGYAEAGAAAIAIIHSSEKTAPLAQQRAEELQAKYPATKAKAYKANVAEAAEIEAATAQVFDDFGRLDVVVVNAGVYTDTKALEMKPQEAQNITGVNYFGALYTAQAAAR